MPSGKRDLTALRRELKKFLHSDGNLSSSESSSILQVFDTSCQMAQMLNSKSDDLSDGEEYRCLKSKRRCPIGKGRERKLCQ